MKEIARALIGLGAVGILVVGFGGTFGSGGTGGQGPGTGSAEGARAENGDGRLVERKLPAAERGQAVVASRNLVQVGIADFTEGGAPTVRWLKEKERLVRLKVEGRRERPRVAVSDDGALLAMSYQDPRDAEENLVALSDEEGNAIGTIKRRGARDVKVSGDGSVVGILTDSRLYFHSRDGRELMDVDPPGGFWLSPDGRWKAIANGNDVDLYDGRAEGGERTPVHTLATHLPPRDMVFSADGSVLAIVDAKTRYRVRLRDFRVLETAGSDPEYTLTSIALGETRTAVGSIKVLERARRDRERGPVPGRARVRIEVFARGTLVDQVEFVTGRWNARGPRVGFHADLGALTIRTRDEWYDWTLR